MFTTEEGAKFFFDYNKFVDTCNHVSELLEPLNEDYKNIVRWFLVKDETKNLYVVAGEGGTDCWGEWCNAFVFFPIALLTYDDDRIKRYVEDELEERKQAELDRQKKLDEQYNIRKKELLNLSKEELIEKILDK